MARLASEVLRAIDSGDMTVAAESFRTAIIYLHSECIETCLSVLNSLPRKLPRSLMAEADYIRAAGLLATRSETDRERALDILGGWSGYEDDESELGMRLMRLRLYGMTLAVDKTQARTLERRIRQLLIQRVEFDESAEDDIYTLDRCSGSVDEPEVSLFRVRDAVQHYGPRAGQTVVRRPIEYYRCLVNFGAKLLTTAAYGRAREIYLQLEEMICDFEPNTFPRLDYPRAGSVLADFRVGAIDTAVAIERQRKICQMDQPSNDPFYAQNALAVYLAIAGTGEESLEIFDSLVDLLNQKSRPAPSMLYLLRANCCAVRYVNGGGDAALFEWQTLDSLVREIPYSIGRYLVLRHQLLAEVMSHGEALSSVEFDECLLGEERFGPLWNQIGRGFRMPEVEWWL